MSRIESLTVLVVCEECQWARRAIVDNPRSKTDVFTQLQNQHLGARLYCDGSPEDGSVQIIEVLEGTFQNLPDTHIPTEEEARLDNYFKQLSKSLQNNPIIK